MNPSPRAAPAEMPVADALAALPPACDVLVVGGGINGCGIARDLAGRGVSVLLCEQDDLAAHTSSSSTKLVHGGLRYLEHYEFSLVRKALAEREVLLRSAPHIMWPLSFVMPHDPGMRPVWMIRAGLFLYDHLARRELLPASRTVDLRTHPAGRPLKPQFRKGFVYADGWVDDARLVVLNAVDAAERGAHVLTRTRCVRAERGAEDWRVQLRSAEGEMRQVASRALVNAAGPWAGQFLKEHVHLPGAKTLRLVKGSHVVVPRLFEHDHAYIFQSPDKRVIFAIPYEGRFTLIGTTDVEHRGAVGEARIDAGEIDYLCAQASRYFAKPVRADDVVWTYSGVRPLLDDETTDPSAVTRDYLLELDEAGAPLLTVWGGKITTFRRLAEEAADALCAATRALRGRAGGCWTRGALLPGGDLAAWSAGAAAAGRAEPASIARGAGEFDRFELALSRRHPELSAGLAHRYARCYGTRVEMLLANGSLGEEIAPGLHEAEVTYLRRHEWARSAADVLWRRTKLGLHMNAAERERVAQWWTGRDPSGAARRERAWN